MRRVKEVLEALFVVLIGFNLHAKVAYEIDRGVDGVEQDGDEFWSAVDRALTFLFWSVVFLVFLHMAV